jgi:hypothetical protein
LFVAGANGGLTSYTGFEVQFTADIHHLLPDFVLQYLELISVETELVPESTNAGEEDWKREENTENAKD